MVASVSPNYENGGKMKERIGNGRIKVAPNNGKLFQMWRKKVILFFHFEQTKTLLPS
jgi:hypothetical protein